MIFQPPGGKRFDYLTIDADDGYLLSAHLGAGQTYVISLSTNEVVVVVRDTPGAEGVELIPELKKFYTSNAGDNTIGVVDLTQMKVVKKIPTEAKPDGSVYAAPFHKLYVSDERGKAEAVVDVRTDAVVKTPPLRQRDRDAAIRSRGTQGLRQPAGPGRAGHHRSGDRHGRRPLPRRPLQGQSRDGSGSGARPRVSRLRRQSPDDGLRPARASADRVPADRPGSRRHQYDSGLRRVYVACGSGAI